MKVEPFADLINLGNMFITIYLFQKKEGIDKFIIYFKIITLMCYLIGRVCNKAMFLTWFHFLLTLLMFLIAVFSKDKDLLLYLCLMSNFIIFTRRFFNRCLLRKVEKKSKLTDNKFFDKLNWDVIFLILGMIGMLKLHYFYM
tara:strand:+ start:663 stop:1088 length:426 start_codon:yes stop_codon:yes gene_type:complete